MRFSTRIILASLLGLAGLSTHVDAHAKLSSPQAWNGNPSKSGTCGVNAANANPASYKPTVLGSTLEVKWTVVIGDGNGPITAKLDTTAKTNPTVNDFTVNLIDTKEFPNRQPTVSTTPYTVRFTIPPNTKCTGPQNTCTLRVASSTNWIACATIQLEGQLPVVNTPAPVQTPAPTKAATTKPPTTTQPPVVTQTPPTTEEPPVDPVTQAPPAVTDAPTDPPVTTPVPTRNPIEYYPYPSSLNNCVQPTDLEICTNINGQSVQLMGINPKIIEAQAKEQIDFDMTNPAVLERPNTSGCLEALTDLICAQMFPLCRSDATVVCTSSCQRVNNLCKPNATAIIDELGGKSSHAELFDCSNTKLGYTETAADSNGNCPNVNTGIRPLTLPTTPGTTTQKPISLSSTGRNHASSVQSSFTVVMGVVTLLLAFVARV